MSRKTIILFKNPKSSHHKQSTIIRKYYTFEVQKKVQNKSLESSGMFPETEIRIIVEEKKLR
jgi:hypothetical protein